MVTIEIPSIIALGIVLLGSFISSAGIVEISKPAYAQNIKTRAIPKFENPCGENGVKFDAAMVGFKII